MPWWQSADVRSTAYAALIGVLVGSVLTGGTSILVTKITIDAQKTAQQADFADKHAQESRLKNAAVYTNVLKTANVWLNTRQTEVTCRSIPPSFTGCLPAQKVFDDNQAFRDAVYDVYICGSDEANAAALKIAARIPGTWPGIGQGVDVAVSTPFNVNEYAGAVGQFQRQMCKELQAQGNKPC